MRSPATPTPPAKFPGRRRLPEARHAELLDQTTDRSTGVGEPRGGEQPGGWGWGYLGGAQEDDILLASAAGAAAGGGGGFGGAAEEAAQQRRGAARHRSSWIGNRRTGDGEEDALFCSSWYYHRTAEISCFFLLFSFGEEVFLFSRKNNT